MDVRKASTWVHEDLYIIYLSNHISIYLSNHISIYLSIQVKEVGGRKASTWVHEDDIEEEEDER